MHGELRMDTGGEFGEEQQDECRDFVTSCGATEEECDESRMETGGDDIGEERQDACNDCGEDGGDKSNTNGSSEYLSNLVLQDCLTM